VMAMSPKASHLPSGEKRTTLTAFPFMCPCKTFTNFPSAKSSPCRSVPTGREKALTVREKGDGGDGAFVGFPSSERAQGLEGEGRKEPEQRGCQQSRCDPDKPKFPHGLPACFRHAPLPPPTNLTPLPCLRTSLVMQV
jgi:hypothetical protein